MKILLVTAFAFGLSAQAQTTGSTISISVNNSTASSSGPDAQALIAELLTLGVPAQDHTSDPNFAYTAYTLQGLVHSTQASCDQSDQTETTLENLVSDKENDTTVIATIPDVDSPCGSSGSTGANALDGILGQYMASGFQPDQGMSQMRYKFSIDCDHYASDDSYSCVVNISNGDESGI